MNEGMNETVQMRDDIRFLLSFVPPWAKDVPEGLDPTFYGTLTAAGDREVKAHVDAIRARYAAPQVPQEGKDD